MSVQRPNKLSGPHLVAACAVMLLTIGTAQAQWQWLDDGGRKVFSDTAPPASVPDKNILRRPQERGTSAPKASAERDVPTAEPAAEAASPAPAMTRQDAQLEARKKQAEAEEKARQQAEDARIARIRQENCERATRSRKTLVSGVRMATTNSKGNMEFLDDKARASEIQRLDRIMAQDCGPMPVTQ
ncbi:MAG: DUF4124 domain-containing protein [Burkholderiaceae bacterium]